MHCIAFSTHSRLVFLIYFVITPTPVDGTGKHDIHNHDDIGVILESAQDY